MMEHVWITTPYGYDPSDYCKHCGASNYASYGTKYCEEYKQIQVENDQKKNGTHKPTNETKEYARSVLSKTQWELLKIPFPYRDIDKLIV